MASTSGFLLFLTGYKSLNKFNAFFGLFAIVDRSKIWKYIHIYHFIKWLGFKNRLSLIVRVNVVQNRTVVVDSGWRFDNLCGGPLQSQSELYHVSRWYYTLKNYIDSSVLLTILNQETYSAQSPVNFDSLTWTQLLFPNGFPKLSFFHTTAFVLLLIYFLKREGNGCHI